MTVSLAIAKKISVDDAVAAVLSEVEGMLALKDEQRMALKVFLGGKDVLTLLLTGCGKSIAPPTNRRHRAVATWFNWQ